MGKLKDLTGMKFGRLTVINRIDYTHWLCKCDCGNEKIVTGYNLCEGKIKSCGCLARDIKEGKVHLTRLDDLTGMKFGRLTVIERAENSPSGLTRWLCRCDCGNMHTVLAQSLKGGSVKSCGCLARDIRLGKVPRDDLTGKKFGKLTVIERSKNYKLGYGQWRCKCECGNERIVSKDMLERGKVVSCVKCEIEPENAERENAKINNKKKPRTKDILRAEWTGIKQRCFNPNNNSYKSYGGRGITMYPAWVDDFQAFYDYLSQLENFEDQSYTLDRIDPNGNYEPANVRWADAKTQARNKRNTVFVDYYGEIIPIGEAAERCGIDAGVLYTRLRKNLKGDALFAPI